MNRNRLLEVVARSTRTMALPLLALALATAPSAEAAPSGTWSITGSQTLPEGNSGLTAFSFQVAFVRDANGTAGVTWTATGVTATAGAACGGSVDFLSASGTVQYVGNTSGSQTVTVFVCGDTIGEDDETFVVTLSDPTGQSVIDPALSEVTGTIQNDDAPSLTVGDVSLAEGDAGTTAFTFTVTKSGSTLDTVTVDWSTAAGTASGGVACGAGVDFENAAGSLSFGPSETTKQAVVLVCGDTVNEANETFTVNLSNVANGTIYDGQGVGTILNDDPAPTLTIDDVSLPEGHAGTTGFIFTVTKAGATEQTATVDWATSGVTATGGIACGPGVDFVSAAGSLSLGPSETTKQVTVQVCGDTDDEAHETFTVDLSNPVAATVSDAQGVGTILNDDTTTMLVSGLPDPSVVGQAVTFTYSVTAGDGGTPTGTVTVSDGTSSCSAPVEAGSCEIAFPSAGVTSVTATSAGDGSYGGSASAAVSHTVNPAQTTTTITSDNPDPSTATQSVTVTYSVTVNGPGDGTPTGDVTVSDGTDSCVGTVAEGSCSLTLTTTGARLLTATYAGDPDFAGSVSNEEPHTVQVTFDLGITIVGDGSVEDAGNAISCGSSCTVPVAEGTTVTLSATPGPGFVFFGWSGEARTGTGTCEVLMDQARAVTATFGPSNASKYFPVTPCRLADTRDPDGPYGGPFLSGGVARPFAVGGVCGIPAEAKAVVLNVTMTQGTETDSVVAYPGSGADPGTDVVHAAAGRTRASNVLVGIEGGVFSVRNRQITGQVHVVIDVSGYFR